MNLISLVLVNLGRNKRRTVLTFLSVMVALFLFCALGGVLDTLQESIKVGSETRLVVRNAISLVFPMPLSYRERIAAVPGVKRVAISQWFGGQDPKDPTTSTRSSASTTSTTRSTRRTSTLSPPRRRRRRVSVPDGIDPKLATYLVEQDACIVGRKLLEKMHWRLGQKVTVAGTIFPGSWEFTIRAVYAREEEVVRRGDDVVPLEVPRRARHVRPGSGRDLHPRAVGPGRGPRKSGSRSTTCSRTHRQRPAPRASRPSRPGS